MASRRKRIYTFARIVVPPVIRFWVRLDCEGLPYVPSNGPVIIAANHISYFDPLCLGVFVDATGRQARFLAKAELFQGRLLGWLLRAAGQIPVYRETRDAARSLVEAVAAMREGAAVVIYPEGTTTRNPDFSPMLPKSGVARLAALTGAPPPGCRPSSASSAWPWRCCAPRSCRSSGTTRRWCCTASAAPAATATV